MAGQGTADMSMVTEHYVKRHQIMEDERVAKIVDGKITTVYDDTTGGRFPSWVPWVGRKEEAKPTSKK